MLGRPNISTSAPKVGGRTACRQCLDLEHDDYAICHPAFHARDAAGLSGPRCFLRRAVLPGRPHHRHLLPADLPGPEAATEERRILPHRPCRPGRRLSSLQAVPPAGSGRPAGVGCRSCSPTSSRAGGPSVRAGSPQPRHRSGHRATLFPATLRHDVSSVRSGPPTGRGVHADSRGGERR